MIEVKGKYNAAKVYTECVDSATLDQVRDFANMKYLDGQKIRIMPDCHAGKGVCIGFTSTFKDKLDPATVGCDIGCGMLVNELGKIDIDFEKLDQVIRKYVPNGKGKIHDHYALAKISPDLAIQLRKDLMSMKAKVEIDKNLYSIGTLGQGNHFLEIDEDDEGNKYLVIHTGSRHLGIEVEKYYSKIAKTTDNHNSRKELVEKLKAEHREKDIQKELAKIEDEPKEVYIAGEDLKNYLHDMEIAQRFASLNRSTIGFTICEKMGWRAESVWTTMHNYIDIENKIIRKGAISCAEGEKVIIPMNMRDGSLICRGKGNPDTNYSGPHGAGRLYSRAKAKEIFTVENFKNTMEGIWTSCISDSTLDESPMAYKDMSSIIENIQPMAEVIKIIKPIYNFKAN